MNTSRFSGRATLLLVAGLTAATMTPAAAAATAEEQAQQVAEKELRAQQAEEKELQARLEQEYARAMEAAEKQQREAEESMRTAREQLRQASEKQREEAQKATEESQKLREAQQAEMQKMHEELDRVRRQLRETSREIARVDREVARARMAEGAYSYALRTSNKPVIGVILGDADDVGVKVLGVSPDGPAERAGIKQGDVIIAIGGQVLASIKDTENARDALRVAMKDVKAEEPLTVTFERENKTIDVEVVPEVREPLSWTTVTRLPSAPRVAAIAASPAEPGKVISIESIVVPEIDTDEIAEQIEKLRVEIGERNVFLDKDAIAPVDGQYEFEFHEMSELGDFALHDANVWFGLPMTRGLQLAEIDPALGEYFKTDRGVLVLKAKEDNELQLVSGDVILQVGDSEVNSPAEFMRALRGFEAGDKVQMNIKRKRKNQELEIVMPENRTSFFHTKDGNLHTFKITSE